MGFVVAVSSRVVWDFVFSEDHFWFRVSIVGIGGIFPFVQRVWGGESRSVPRLEMFLSILFGVLQNSRGVGCPLVAQADFRRV